MSATSNLVHNLEHRLSHLRGEREAAATEVRSIEESITRLSALHEQIASLDKAIQAAETLLLYDRPDWQSSRVKAVRPRVWKSPFRSGEIGRTALTVLRESGSWMKFETGRLFPSYEKLAELAGCSPNGAKAAVKRLCYHGIISKVRRTMKTGNAGEMGPQREQTSNGYFFEHQRRMKPNVWQRFKQLLVRKMRRLGAVPAAVAAKAAAAVLPLSADALALRGAMADLGLSVSRHAST